jgi:hypothetical protein
MDYSRLPAGLTLLLVASLLASCFFRPKPTHLMNIAVAELGRGNVSASESAMMSELLRGEMVRTNSFRVVEKNNMDKILAEHAFQSTGCTDQECAVKLGRILNVERMAVGTFGELMGKKVLLVRLVDVETGEVVCSDSARGESLEKLEKAVGLMARRLSACARTAKPKFPVLAPETGQASPVPPAATAETLPAAEVQALSVRNMPEGPKTWTFTPFQGNRSISWNRSIIFTNNDRTQSISIGRIDMKITGMDGATLYEAQELIGTREVDGTPGLYGGLPIHLEPGQTRNIFIGAFAIITEVQDRVIRDIESRVSLIFHYTVGKSTPERSRELVIRINGSWAKSKMAPGK